MIKIIFFDIDGTLVSHETPHIPESTKQAFKQLQAQGVKLWVSTGRHITEIVGSHFDEEYPFDGYITCNGNFCYSGDKVVYSKPIPKEDLLAATKFALEKDYAIFFCMEKDAFVTMYNDRVRALEALFGYKVDVTNDTSRIEKEDCYMLVTYCGQEKTKEILEYMPNCKGTSWHEITTDIINTDSGKGDGIAHVLEYYGLTKEEAMAFGDGDNDIEMLDAVQYPIVMENALEHVKTHGIYTTGTVETEGITTALKHFKLI